MILSGFFETTPGITFPDCPGNALESASGIDYNKKANINSIFGGKGRFV